MHLDSWASLHSSDSVFPTVSTSCVLICYSLGVLLSALNGCLLRPLICRFVLLKHIQGVLSLTAWSNLHECTKTNKYASTHQRVSSHSHAQMHQRTQRHTRIQITNYQPRQSKLNPKGTWLCNFGWIAASLCGIIATIRLKAVSFQYQSGCNEGWMTLGKGTIAQILLLINVADVRNMN